MPQVSLYLEQEILDVARRNARIENISLSKYVSRELGKSVGSGWPKGYWKLFGALEDESFTRPADLPFDQAAKPVEFS
jgi:hypothetical protein